MCLWAVRAIASLLVPLNTDVSSVRHHGIDTRNIRAHRYGIEGVKSTSLMDW